MADEVKDGAAADGAAAKKAKKINRLSLDEINKKIEALESGKQIQSKFYKHLSQRKAELAK